MKWKKLFWYILTILLFMFLAYYAIQSIREIITVYSSDYTIGEKFLGIMGNVFILIIELLSAFYSIFIYYYIGSSSTYKIIKDENNRFLQQDPLPFVVIALPLYKEPLVVVSKTIDGVLNLDYPKDRFQVVVCDDSPEGYSTDIEEYCRENGVKYIQRKSRKGFKAGALNNALKLVECDFFGILDADHIPTPNFIRSCLSGFTNDKTMLVQGRPLFVNQDNFMQRSSAYIHTQFFHVYQKSRGTRGAAIFAGTTGIFRADLFRENGGFLEDTLAEDTDTSFYMMSKGYKFQYVNEVCSKGLVPWGPISMVNQIWRWTNGITSILRKRFWKILRGKNSLINKVDIFSSIFTPVIGVTMWLVYILLLVMFYLDKYVMNLPFARPSPSNIPLLLLAPVLISFASLIMAFISWLREEKEDKMIRLRGFKGMVWTISVFYLLILTAQSFLVWAVLSALFGVKKDFDRTIKEKQKTLGSINQKLKYTLWSIGLLLLAVVFCIAIYHAIIVGNALYGWFIMAALSGTIPIIIVILYFKEIEVFKQFASTKTVVDVEKEYEEQLDDRS